MHSSHSTTEVTVQQSQKVADALSKIVASVSAIVGMSHQIAGAAEEQSVVAKNIESNVRQILDLGKETEANAKRSLDVSDALSDDTQALRDIVQRFKVYSPFTGHKNVESLMLFYYSYLLGDSTT